MNILRAIILVVTLVAASTAMADGFSGGFPVGGQGVNPSSSSTIYTLPADQALYGLGSGYGWSLGDTVLFGVEGFVDMAPDTLQVPLGQLYGSHTYGLGLKIGVHLDSLMPYVRLGYDQIYGSGAFSGINAGAANGGLGLLYKFAPSWSLEGAWSAYAPSAGGLKLKSNSVSIGLNYRFGSTGYSSTSRK